MVVAGEEISEEIVKQFVGVVVASGHDGIEVAVHFGVLEVIGQDSADDELE